MSDEKMRQAPVAFPNEIATNAASRSKSRRIVQTPDGIFLIRRIRSLDYLLGRTPIVIPATMTKKKMTEQELANFAQKQAEIAVDTKREAWVRVMYEQGTVSEELYAIDVAGEKTWSIEQPPLESDGPARISARTSKIVLSEDAGENEISAFALEDETLVIILNEVQRFSGFTARADIEGQLDGFREAVDTDDRPASAEIPKVAP